MDSSFRGRWVWFGLGSIGINHLIINGESGRSNWRERRDETTRPRWFFFSSSSSSLSAPRLPSLFLFLFLDPCFICDSSLRLCKYFFYLSLFFFSSVLIFVWLGIRSSSERFRPFFLTQGWQKFRKETSEKMVLFFSFFLLMISSLFKSPHLLWSLI